MRILMVAAENGALPGGKVGGMGDVMRDVPPAVASLGHEVRVIVPAYGVFAFRPGARLRARIEAPFAGSNSTVELYSLPLDKPAEGVRQQVLEHPLFQQCGVGQIYCDDPPWRPFATDASKFALFCSAIAEGLLDGSVVHPDVIHLHDWHSALLAVLLRCTPRYAALRDIPLVYTIHNLALQGIRPFGGDSSSLEAWFPGLDCDRRPLGDPRYPECFNPMRAAINLCDRVHAVSPQYADEICSDSTDAGAGLQADLAAARNADRLIGILNGCEYPEQPPQARGQAAFLALAREEVMRWMGTQTVVRAAHLIALQRIGTLQEDPASAPRILLTSVGRLTDQKLGIMQETMADGRSCLDHVLDVAGDDSLLVVLGSGSEALEQLFAETAGRRSNLLFLCGYSDGLSEDLYASGDLFLMPSTFEPCGISQMLAMRAGQPCLVNHVGGLVNTVVDEHNGFVFSADTPAERAQALIKRLRQALTRIRYHSRRYAAMREAAAAARFYWRDTAISYVEQLYADVGSSERHHQGHPPSH